MVRARPLGPRLQMMKVRAASAHVFRFVFLIAAGLMTVFVSLLIFITTTEWFFWDEFGARFNFIAVDYLIRTQELLGNISESYPMGPILAGIGALAGGIVWLLFRKVSTYTGDCTPLDQAKSRDLVHDATVFYQSASWLFGSGGLKRHPGGQGALHEHGVVSSRAAN